MSAPTASSKYMDQSAFHYDYETLRTTGVILAVVMFVAGILIALNLVWKTALTRQKLKFRLRRCKDLCVAVLEQTQGCGGELICFLTFSDLHRREVARFLFLSTANVLHRACLSFTIWRHLPMMPPACHDGCDFKSPEKNFAFIILSKLSIFIQLIISQVLF